MSKKFVKNEHEINAFQGLAIMQDGRLVPAKIVGGRCSRSGKTSSPTWAEEGAFIIFRKDEFISKIARSLREDTPHNIECPYFFTGHGTAWETVSEVNIQGLEIALTSWMKFRKEGINLPSSSSVEEKLAREYSLASFRISGSITEFEAMELLPRWSTWAEMEWDEEDEDGMAARIWSERGHAWTADLSRGIWHFVPEGCLSTWTDEEEGWEYISRLSCSDRRWYRHRQKTGTIEVEKTEDSYIWEKI